MHRRPLHALRTRFRWPLRIRKFAIKVLAKMRRSPSTNSQPFPFDLHFVDESKPWRLPTELIMEIFVYAVQLGLNEIHILSMVCTWTRSWLLPYVFYTMAVGRAPGMPITIPPAIATVVSHLQIHPLVKSRGAPFLDVWPSSAFTLSLSLETLVEIKPLMERWYAERETRSAPQSSRIPSLDIPNEHCAFACRRLFIIGGDREVDWRSLASSPAGRAFLRGITQLRVGPVDPNFPYPLLDCMPHLAILVMPYARLSASEPLLRFIEECVKRFPRIQMIVVELQYGPVESRLSEQLPDPERGVEIYVLQRALVAAERASLTLPVQWLYGFITLPG